MRKLKIAITVDPEIPVPPVKYGGIERIVEMLVLGLKQSGHEVTLFCNPGSTVDCIRKSYPGMSSKDSGDILRNMFYVSKTVLKGNFDVVHSFARLAYLLPLLPLKIPKIMSYQRLVTDRSITLGSLLSFNRLHYSACSRHIYQKFSDHTKWHLIYNGVPSQRYDYSASVAPDAPALFLGRIEKIKGTHLAIEAAVRSGKRLIIAGNIPDAPEHIRYFEEFIKPHIDDQTIQYAGPVDDTQKNELLGKACALLMPILWNEPFGIVMAEALACGTPVIAFRRGSAMEIVEHGVNGFLCDTVEEMADALNNIHTIDRAKCRQEMEKNFSDDVITAKYESLYYSLLN